MAAKRKFFPFQNICRGSQPSTKNTHTYQKVREWLLAKVTDPPPRTWQTHWRDEIGTYRKGSITLHRVVGSFTHEGPCMRQVVSWPLLYSRRGLPPGLCLALLQCMHVVFSHSAYLITVWRCMGLSQRQKFAFLTKPLTLSVCIFILEKNMILPVPLDLPPTHAITPSGVQGEPCCLSKETHGCPAEPSSVGRGALGLGAVGTPSLPT